MNDVKRIGATEAIGIIYCTLWTFFSLVICIKHISSVAVKALYKDLLSIQINKVMSFKTN